MVDFLYSANDTTNLNPLKTQFHLHSHSDYEIYLFLEGNSKYVVEEKIYDLSPGDIIIIRKHDMHRVFHMGNQKYHRIVLMVSPDFFKRNNCAEYETVFLNKHAKAGHRINAEIVRSSGLLDAIMRLKYYSENFSNLYAPVSESIVTEILYLLNHVSAFETADTTNKIVKNVIDYINAHFTAEITLDALCEKFFVSKFYLCHIFKAATGLTIQQYIRQKRLTLADTLRSEGKTLTEAALSSGFGDYSSFYRAYVKKNHKSPREPM